jgi:hypothetical protein
MIALFSIMFGAGLFLQADRAAKMSRSPAGLFYRRAAIPLLIGLAHAYLAWDGDILVTYALCGILVYPSGGCPPARSPWWASWSYSRRCRSDSPSRPYSRPPGPLRTGSSWARIYRPRTGTWQPPGSASAGRSARPRKRFAPPSRRPGRHLTGSRSAGRPPKAFALQTKRGRGGVRLAGRRADDDRHGADEARSIRRHPAQGILPAARPRRVRRRAAAGVAVRALADRP